MLIALAVALLVLAFRKVDLAHLRDGFRQVHYGWVGLALLVGLAAHTVRAIRWRILIEPIDHRLPLLNVLCAVFVGYLTNLAFPRLGEVAKCGSISKTDGTRFESLLGTVVVERTSDLLLTLLLTLLVLALRFERFGAFIIERIALPLRDKLLAVSALAYVTMAVVGTVVVAGAVLAVRRNLLGERISGKLRQLWQGMADGLRSLFGSGRMPAFLALTVLLWAAYWGMTWAVLRSTPITAGLGPIDALFIMVVGTYGMVVPVQGGFGAFHIITAISLGIYGISYDDGLLFAIVSHESQTLLLIAGGLAAFIYLYLRRYRASNKRTNSTPSGHQNVVEED